MCTAVATFSVARAFGIGLPLAAQLRRGHWNRPATARTKLTLDDVPFNGRFDGGTHMVCLEWLLMKPVGSQFYCGNAGILGRLA